MRYQFRDNFTEVQVPKLTKKNRHSRFLIPGLLLCVAGFLWMGFSRPQPKRYTLARIAIDAGHGGHDSGCLGSKTKEKDIALAISLKLGKMIEENFDDVKVIYTRKTDQFVELHQRAEIANNAKADLFICIHCNSACYLDKKHKEVCNTETRGAETWVMGLKKSEANLEVAKRENEAVLLEKDYKQQYGFDPNSPEANIIFSLYQNTYLDQSLRMASLVQQELNSKGRNGRGVKQAGFLVLYKTYMPSILVETGFLSQPDEEEYLASEKGQTEMARSIFKAFKAYKASLESGVSSPDASDDHPDTGNKEDDKQVKEDMKVKVDSPPAKKPVVETPVKPITHAPKVVKPEANQKNDSAEDKQPGESTGQIVYRVQILLSPKAIPKGSPKFKGVNDAREEKVDNVFKYTTGYFTKMEDAVNLQTTMRSGGFADAFVVPYLNNKRISIKEARERKKKSD